MSERQAATIMLGISLVVGCALLTFVRLLWVGPPPWSWTVLGLLYVLACLPVIRRANTRARAVLIALFFVPLAPIPITGQERFVRDLFRIEPGMSSSQADALMKGYLRGSGWKGPQSLGPGEVQVPGCEIYRHSNEGNYDSDWGVVCMEGGKVVSVEFWPD